MGTKRKVWLANQDDERWLFKYPRSTTSGEDWAEKVVAEIAGLIGIPHAESELAEFRGDRGVVVKDFLRRDKDGLTEVLIHGNELLGVGDPGYPRDRKYRVAEHTVERVERAVSALKIDPPKADSSGLDGLGVFVGYLLLDTLVSNQDRHHENWAVCLSVEGTPRFELAPTFDHASSLGFNETDEKRNERLQSRDSRFGIRAYVSRAKSALYRAGQTKPLTTMEAFQYFAQQRQAAAQLWRSRLFAISRSDFEVVVRRMPECRMSDTAKQFALAILSENQDRLREG